MLPQPPDRHAAETQQSGCPPVAALIPFDFGQPVFSVRLRQSEVHGAAVKEAAVHEERQSEPWNIHVWRAMHMASVLKRADAIADGSEYRFPHETGQRRFRLVARGSNPRHNPTSLIWRYGVHPEFRLNVAGRTPRVRRHRD